MNNILYYAKPDLIKNYDKLSQEYGLTHTDKSVKRILSEEELTLVLEENKKIISVSKPILHDLYKLVRGTGFFLELLDKEGIVLDIIGDKDIVDLVIKYDMNIGSSMSLESAGTNAISIAIIERMPCQLMGKHHFMDIFKQFTCSCAPIYSESGDIVANINLNGYESKVHEHTLALVVAAAKSIENKLLYNDSIEKLEESFDIVNSILESVSDAMISCDNNGFIKSINSSGCNILEKTDALKTNVLDYFYNADKDDFLKYYKNKNYILTNNKRVLVDCNPNYFNNKSYGYTIIIKDIQDIINTIEKENRNIATKYFKDILYVSRYMHNLIEKAKIISKSPANVLISGEKGVGKMLFAKAIFNESANSNGKFIIVDLLKDDINDLEKKDSILSLKNTTVVFKNISYIDSEKVDLLLQAINNHKSYNSLNARLITLSEYNLEDRALQEEFNYELYVELSVVNFHILPLRERRDDLKYYIKIFLKQICSQQNRDTPIIRDDIFNKLMTYDYKYNMIELQKIIERIVALDGELEFEQEFKSNKHMIRKIVNFENETMPLKKLEEIAIINALEKYNYNYSTVAKKLGITRSTLYTKTKKLK